MNIAGAGDFGSGYPSDPKTIRFIWEWFCKHKRFPEWVRHSWKTARNVMRQQDTDMTLQHWFDSSFKDEMVNEGGSYIKKGKNNR